MAPLAVIALLAAATAPSAWADSSASSAVSDSFATSVGSISGSFEHSSDSSSNDNKVAAGDYRIVEMAAAPTRPGTLRLKLQALADTTPKGELLLLVPEPTAAQGGLAAGQIVSARLRPYGVEFAHRDNGQPFFLVLADDWYRELQTTVVKL